MDDALDDFKTQASFEKRHRRTRRVHERGPSGAARRGQDREGPTHITRCVDSCTNSPHKSKAEGQTPRGQAAEIDVPIFRDGNHPSVERELVFSQSTQAASLVFPGNINFRSLTLSSSPPDRSGLSFSRILSFSRLTSAPTESSESSPHVSVRLGWTESGYRPTPVMISGSIPKFRRSS